MTRSAEPSSTGRLAEAKFCSFYENELRETKFHQENRRFARFVHEEPVVLETQAGDLVGAVVMNYSQDGLYFESDLNAEQGTVVRIRNESTLSGSERGGCHAEVRWSRRLDDRCDYRFGTGVRYCRRRMGHDIVGCEG